MILESLQITLIGMGGVFTFLLILISGMTVLSRCVKDTCPKTLDKIAVAIAAARAQDG